MTHRLFQLMLVFIFAGICQSCTVANGDAKKAMAEKPSPEALAGLHKAYFASGCFWCVEAIFEEVRGVKEAVSGYAGGDSENPTYGTVSTGRSSHAEAVAVYYDSSEVDFSTLVRVFFGSHDPTTLNRQGPDAGPQYRSIAFYRNPGEERSIRAEFRRLVTTGEYRAGEIVTEIVALDKFYPAEDYHQDYEKKHPNNSYIRAVSIPRLKRFQAKFPELLKTH